VSFHHRRIALRHKNRTPINDASRARPADWQAPLSTRPSLDERRQHRKRIAEIEQDPLEIPLHRPRRATALARFGALDSPHADSRSATASCSAFR
jgi:hypothetical protein